MLQEPHLNERGDCSVDIKRNCFHAPEARAAIYAPDVRDANILPNWDLMEADMAVVSLEIKISAAVLVDPEIHILWL